MVRFEFYDFKFQISNVFNKFIECLRKRARGDVTIRSPGTGKIVINGDDIGYFSYDQAREQVSLSMAQKIYMKMQQIKSAK